jgi:hypothetical protein
MRRSRVLKRMEEGGGRRSRTERKNDLAAAAKVLRTS